MRQQTKVVRCIETLQMNEDTMTISKAINNATRRIPAWPLYILGTLPIIWAFYAGINGLWGVDPAKAIERQVGLWGLQLLIASLAITPLRNYLNINLIKYRRAIGLLTFFYIVVHLLVWIVLDFQFYWAEMWGDIVKRPYITIGMAGFIAMIPLAITSNNRSIRKMGPQVWNKLHKLTYFAVIAGGVHFLMVVKGWQVEPMFYLAAIFGLLFLRVIHTRQKTAKRCVMA